jgi:BMFP domain-containing protein YqiC
MRTETIDRLAKRLAEAVPEGLRAVRDDLEQNFRSVLDSGLSRLDLVTREEFEVQQAVLARTRQKLEALERRVSGLEGSPDTGTTGSAAKDTETGK